MVLDDRFDKRLGMQKLLYSSFCKAHWIASTTQLHCHHVDFLAFISVTMLIVVETSTDSQDVFQVAKMVYATYVRRWLPSFDLVVFVLL